MTPTFVKKRHMRQLADYRDNELRKRPVLKSLFFELTDVCNERCRHCGSRCGEGMPGTAGYVNAAGAAGDAGPDGMPVGPGTSGYSAPGAVPMRRRIMQPSDWKRVLDEVKDDFDLNQMRLCITGGEPLLYPGFREVMEHAHALGYRWGMTSNGTLIDDKVALRLRKLGMRTISISLDGLRETHDAFRQLDGAYDGAVNGIRSLLRVGGFDHVQVTTVVHHDSYPELDDMLAEFGRLGVKSWRVINVEPMGRALDSPEIMLTPAEMKGMMDFIEKHRNEGAMQVTYGCSHYLGPARERESRDWYFLCNSGIYTASITHEGNCVGCLDLPRRPELVQGSVHEDRFADVWRNRYETFRTDYRKKGECAECEHYAYCAGDSFHTWDFDRDEPGACMKGILF